MTVLQANTEYIKSAKLALHELVNKGINKSEDVKALVRGFFESHQINGEFENVDSFAITLFIAMQAFRKDVSHSVDSIETKAEVANLAPILLSHANRSIIDAENSNPQLSKKSTDFLEMIENASSKEFGEALKNNRKEVIISEEISHSRDTLLDQNKARNSFKQILEARQNNKTPVKKTTSFIRNFINRISTKADSKNQHSK